MFKAAVTLVCHHRRVVAAYTVSHTHKVYITVVRPTTYSFIIVVYTTNYVYVLQSTSTYYVLHISSLNCDEMREFFSFLPCSRRRHLMSFCNVYHHYDDDYYVQYNV